MTFSVLRVCMRFALIRIIHCEKGKRSVRESCTGSYLYSMICVIIPLNLFCQNENEIKCCIPTAFALLYRIDYVKSICSKNTAFAVVDNDDELDKNNNSLMHSATTLTRGLSIIIFILKCTLSFLTLITQQTFLIC
ncbi:hypothetical protein T4C_13252 [Trichinella pseudospiralis]|uniref:Uncharacterized protein n=1 Tax=Trichinella pseudospiralis TaxID=6337 RepID=A0A0V1JBI0_TRIPS|nr:hypothetical protein T4C_13252 [Trichinella pseudospiralis]